MDRKTECLDARGLAAALQQLPGWRHEGQALVREFRFGSFSEAFAFMTRVALLAEAQDHHPDWSNSWNRVIVRLSSHDAGGITARDLRLAQAIDGLVPPG
ncbi:MAG: 4a-hydroxytetrahydrobiopterin dehydratase [Pseudomonadota bacterium]